jgi:hypothetical protein
MHVQRCVGTVSVARSSGWGNDSESLQVANLLHRIPRLSGDINGSERYPSRTAHQLAHQPTPHRHLKVMLEP